MELYTIGDIIDKIDADELPAPYDDMARNVGKTFAIEFAKMFQGTPFYFPKFDIHIDKLLTSHLTAEYNDGKRNTRKLAMRYKITEGEVKKIINKFIGTAQLSFVPEKQFASSSWINDILPEELLEPYDIIAKVFGTDKAFLCGKLYQGQGFYLPKLDDTLAKIRNYNLNRDYQTGRYSFRQLALKYGISERWVREIVGVAADDKQLSWFQ